MAIQDRVAFACNYLSDARLMEYLERLKMRLTEAGNLDGILLTGQYTFSAKVTLVKQFCLEFRMSRNQREILYCKISLLFKNLFSHVFSFFIVGLCPEGIDLLQRYVDLTGDVQTVALVTIHTLQHAVNKDSRLSHWVQR